MDQNLDIKPKTLKLKIGKTLENIDIVHYFLNRSPIAQEIRSVTDKLKYFCNHKKQ
jgi:hypothetical protein